MERTHYLLVAVGVVLVSVLLVGFVLSQPTGSAPAPEPKPANDDLYVRLAEAGIQDAVVDITDERTLVRYELPDNRSKEAITFLIFGEAVEVAPNTPLTVVQVYEDFQPVEEVAVETDTIRAFKNGTIDYGAFREAVTRTNLTTAPE